MIDVKNLLERRLSASSSAEFQFGSDQQCWARELGAPDGTAAPRRCGLALSTDTLPSPLTFEGRATNKTVSGLDFCLDLCFGLFVCIQHGLAVVVQTSSYKEGRNRSGYRD